MNLFESVVSAVLVMFMGGIIAWGRGVGDRFAAVEARVTATEKVIDKMDKLLDILLEDRLARTRAVGN